VRFSARLRERNNRGNETNNSKDARARQNGEYAPKWPRAFDKKPDTTRRGDPNRVTVVAASSRLSGHGVVSLYDHLGCMTFIAAWRGNYRRGATDAVNGEVIHISAREDDDESIGQDCSRGDGRSDGSRRRD
jgi:hypothetical protein